MVPVSDAHCDFLAYQVMKDEATRLFDHLDLASLLHGGVSLQVFAVWVPPESQNRLTCCMDQIGFLQKFMTRSEGQVCLCTKKEHLAEKKGIGAVLAIESGECIDCSLDAIKAAYRMGARMLSLTWNGENAFASGCGCNGGIKPAGKKAIALLDYLGMALDLSHINEQGFWEALELYEGSPCASHSCAYALCPAARNLSDVQIKAIISREGFIGINFYTEFLRGRSATIEDVMAHIEHVLSLGGTAAVGFGSDFCGIQYTPAGLHSAADFQALPEAMARRGYSDALINQICYGNFASYILKFL